MTDATKQAFREWAILELMGHRRLAGLVQEVEFAGAGFVRIDIPATAPVTQMYGPSAVYCITPTTEEIARAIAARCHAEPVSRYELPAARTKAAECCACGVAFGPADAVVLLPGGECMHTYCSRQEIDETDERDGDDAN